ncbi:Fc.00g017610.m01.CDS01 [Cosmosporella sp. VM-42]
MQSPHQPPPQPSNTTPSSHEFTVRPTLPERAVTSDTIEEAYVRFIFYCNPAIPPASETASLREAFRTPPRSGGKSFNTFTVFELVKKFYEKEIRTWTELTTRLGVEPPDPSKDESVQKIAQYGVRLKKWMNSMHVKAFFEYLMDIPNDYWTKIPNDPNPIGQPIRDGVAVEDDMALRALLPHIRPKRGRKRPVDDEAAESPAQKTHLSTGSIVEKFRRSVCETWSAAPDGQGSWATDPSNTNNGGWPTNEAMQTPLTRWPQSAITPTTRGSFWDDALEPRSAITPSKPKLANQRRGPKNVSSAWRPGVLDGGGKARGRPPMVRTPVDGSAPGFPTGTPTVGPGEAPTQVFPRGTDTNYAPLGARSDPPPFQQTFPAPSSGAEVPRPARPSISLQVPERPPTTVRLATPPPIVVVNGEVDGDGGVSQPPEPPQQPEQPNERTNFTEAAGSNATPSDPPSESKDVPIFYFERVGEREHVDEVLGFLTRALLGAQWLDAERKPSYPPTFKEATAIVNTTVEGMWKTASSPEAFLINLAAMAGGRMLISSEARVCRKGNEDGCAKYSCEWEYCFGSIRGLYTMQQDVPLAMLGDPEKEDKPAEEGQGGMTAKDWEKKCNNVLAEMHKKDKELLAMRTKIMNSLRRERS